MKKSKFIPMTKDDKSVEDSRKTKVLKPFNRSVRIGHLKISLATYTGGQIRSGFGICRTYIVLEISFGSSSLSFWYKKQ